MQGFLEKAVSLGLGALVTTKNKVKETVDELVKKGEIGQEEGKKLVGELIKRGEKSKKEIEAQIGKIVKIAIEKLDIPTRKELNAIKSEIEKLKKKLNKKG